MLRLPGHLAAPRYMINSDNRDLEIVARRAEAVDRADGRATSNRSSRRPSAGSRCGRRRRTRSPCARPAAGTVAASQVAVAPPANVDARVLDNPAEGHTREVKSALIDAMIENSGPLALGTDEWLTVAARDNVPRDPLSPGDTADFSTIIFRVKGSDLAGFRAGRMTLEEARQKVEVREY